MDVLLDRKELLWNFETMKCLSGEEISLYNSSISTLFNDSSSSKMIVLIRRLLTDRNTDTNLYIFDSYISAKELLDAHMADKTALVSLYELYHREDDTYHYTRILNKPLYKYNYNHDREDIVHDYTINNIRSFFIYGAKVYKCY